MILASVHFYFCKMIDVFKQNIELIESRSFYSWHFKVMTPDDRINFVNGAAESFVGLLVKEGIISSDDEIKIPICTEQNYIEFVTKFHNMVSRMRPDDGTTQYGSLWTGINILWNATFYFWLYKDIYQSPPKNTYPTNIPALKDKWEIMQSKYVENKERFYWKKYKNEFQGKSQSYRTINPKKRSFVIQCLQTDGLIIINNQSEQNPNGISIIWDNVNVSTPFN